jgi:hypothetical protein
MLEAQYLLFVDVTLGGAREYLRIDLQEACAKLHVAPEEREEYVFFCLAVVAEVAPKRMPVIVSLAAHLSMSGRMSYLLARTLVTKSANMSQKTDLSQKYPFH